MYNGLYAITYPGGQGQYFVFFWGHMILSSIPAFKDRGVKFELRKLLHIIYSLWGD